MAHSKRFHTLAALCLCLFAATSINLSWVQQYHNADSLLMSLISIDRYTPFYWGENRFGVPFPLLTSFIRDYTANLFAQTELIVLASLGCVILFNLYFLHSSLSKSQRWAAGLLSIALSLCVLAPTPNVALMFAIGALPYAQSLFMVLLGMALLFRIPELQTRTRLTGLLFCMALAFWLNPSLTPLAIGLVLCLDFSPSNARWKLRLSALSILAAAAAAAIWFASLYPGSRLLKFVSMEEWLSTARTLWLYTGLYFFHSGRLWTLLALLTALIAVQILRRRIRRDYRIQDLLVFSGAAICLALLIAGIEWVRLSAVTDALSSPRYWTVPVFLLLLLATGWVSAGVVRFLTKGLGSDGALFAAGAFLAVGIVNIFGVPSYGRAASYLAESVTVYDTDEQMLGCTHFVGDYWIGWTSVFQRKSAGGQPIHAISMRAEVVRDQWDWKPWFPRTYCGLTGDPSRELWRQFFHLPPLRETAMRSGPLCKLEVVFPAGSGGQ